MDVPFFDLKAQHARIETEVSAAIAEVFASGRFILGTQVEAFEREFAAYCGARHGVGVGNGTDALALALRACEFDADAEVITVPNTAVATVAAIEQAGARPVLVDVDPQTRTLDPQKLAAAITARTRAIIPVHLYGQPADLAPILAVARAYDLRVIEDCAQAHGAEYQLPNGTWRRVGGIGDLGCFSFYPTKNLGAYGDGGMVVTNDDALAERLRLLRQYGWRERDHSALKGFNSRLDEMQAAILRVKLRHLDAWTAQRRRLAALYTAALQDSALGLPVERACARAVYHLYVVRAAQRSQLRERLQARGIGTLVHYPVPIHLQSAYADLGYEAGAFPQTEQLAREVVSLPLYPELSEDTVRDIARAVRECCDE